MRQACARDTEPGRAFVSWGVGVTPLLEIENLQVQFFTSEGTVRAVDGITYHVEPGETVATLKKENTDHGIGD